jgi:hypothetical protein
MCTFGSTCSKVWGANRLGNSAHVKSTEHHSFFPVSIHGTCLKQGKTWSKCSVILFTILVQRRGSRPNWGNPLLILSLLHTIHNSIYVPAEDWALSLDLDQQRLGVYVCMYMYSRHNSNWLKMRLFSYQIRIRNRKSELMLLKCTCVFWDNNASWEQMEAERRSLDREQRQYFRSWPGESSKSDLSLDLE